jgi:uncharacterized protein with PhoU and TrkA domain
MEKITKKSTYEVEIKKVEEIVPETLVATKSLAELEADLTQAKDSLVYIKQRHADEIVPIQKTIDAFQFRYDEAVRLAIKPVEVVKPVLEEPIAEIIP